MNFQELAPRFKNRSLVLLALGYLTLAQMVAYSDDVRAQSNRILSQASSALGKKEFDKVIALCTQVARTDPKYWRIYSYRGLAHQKLAGQTKDPQIERIRLQRAKADYERYLALAPKSDEDRAPLVDALKAVERRIDELQSSEPKPKPTPVSTTKPSENTIPPDSEPPAPASYEIPSLAASQPVMAHENGVTALAIAPDGASVATGSWIDTGGPNEEKVSRGVISVWLAAMTAALLMSLCDSRFGSPLICVSHGETGEL